MKFLRHFLWKVTILAGFLMFTLFSTIPAFSSETQETRVDGDWIILNKKVVIDASIATLAHFLKMSKNLWQLSPDSRKKPF